jgi:hypothetical protein
MSALICQPDYLSMCISMHARPSRKAQKGGKLLGCNALIEVTRLQRAH